MHQEFLALFMSLSYDEQLMYVLLRSCEVNPDIIEMCKAVMPGKKVSVLSAHSTSEEESEHEEDKPKRKVEGFPGEKELDERLGPWDDDSSLPSDVEDDYDDVVVLEIKRPSDTTTEQQ